MHLLMEVVAEEASHFPYTAVAALAMGAVALGTLGFMAVKKSKSPGA